MSGTKLDFQLVVDIHTTGGSEQPTATAHKGSHTHNGLARHVVKFVRLEIHKFHMSTSTIGTRIFLKLIYNRSSCETGRKPGHQGSYWSISSVWLCTHDGLHICLQDDKRNASLPYTFNNILWLLVHADFQVRKQNAVGKADLRGVIAFAK